MSPIPPSSPAMYMPGTDDSNVALSNGISTPRRSVPNTSVMASAGQAARQAPWPMQSEGPINCALPPISPSTWCSGCSGHAFTQEPQPIQRAASMTGCSETGSAKPADAAFSSTARLWRSLLLRRPRYHAQIATSGAAYTSSSVLSTCALHWSGRDSRNGPEGRHGICGAGGHHDVRTIPKIQVTARSGSMGSCDPVHEYWKWTLLSDDNSSPTRLVFTTQPSVGQKESISRSRGNGPIRRRAADVRCLWEKLG